MIESKLPNVGTTIFTTMSSLAQKHDAVNLGQGFPDFPCDPRLLDVMNEAMRAGHNQYPPMTGVASLREAVAEKVEALYGRCYDAADEVTITAGATQAIHTALTAIVRPGDEVIVFEPVYDSYEPVIRLNGGIPVYAQLRHPDYRPDWAQVRSLITPRTRAIMINTPHNPTATCWPREDMEALATVLAGTGIVPISDDRMEDRLLPGAARADGGISQDAPVCGVHRAYTLAARHCRLHAIQDPRNLARVLPGQAGFLPAQRGVIAPAMAALARKLLCLGALRSPG